MALAEKKKASSNLPATEGHVAWKFVSEMATFLMHGTCLEQCTKITLNLMFVFFLISSSPPQGPRCDQCAPGYYGDPQQTGGQCLPCECSGNIDTQDPESCDLRTGQCLKCLYHTDGPSCAQCQQGYYGSALAQDCRRESFELCLKLIWWSDNTYGDTGDWLYSIWVWFFSFSGIQYFYVMFETCLSQQF